ncbi:Per1-like protein [Flagelloscypha sp. PMI_526]|nr:Per1-like protein [Flagelloscypha sp. PMI_526]
MINSAALAVLVAVSLFSLTSASAGDRDLTFLNCVSNLRDTQCASWDPPLSLSLTNWTCLDDCKYACMHSITSGRIDSGKPVFQYYGKWPFYRLWGMQEPASVAFSLLNLYCHVQGWKRMWRGIPTGHPMKFYFMLLCLININTWIWSAVFHTRDTPRTERWDYFSAGLAILSALYVTVIRIFHLYPKRYNPLTSPHPPSPTPRRLWFTLCLFAYLGHIGYLGLSPRFDYSYNVAANLTVGMIHNLLWLLFSLPLPILTRYPNRPRSYMPPFAKKAAAFVGMTTLAMGLELFDFAPWARTIDAHSLWHLATAPIASYWYGFIVQDCVDESWRMDVVGSRLS